MASAAGPGNYLIASFSYFSSPLHFVLCSCLLDLISPDSFYETLAPELPDVMPDPKFPGPPRGSSGLWYLGSPPVGHLDNCTSTCPTTRAGPCKPPLFLGVVGRKEFWPGET